MDQNIVKKEMADAAVKNLQDVRYRVQKLENPHPLAVVVSFCVVMIIIYMMFSWFIKGRFVGTWIDEKGCVCNIIKNTNDTVTIVYDVKENSGLPVVEGFSTDKGVTATVDGGALYTKLGVNGMINETNDVITMFSHNEKIKTLSRMRL
jgi:pyridoxal biosynthesis lyase PdxS